MQIISVVRDFEMYEKCVKGNPFNVGATITTIDNRVENKGIPTRYNEFLDAYDYSNPDWFVFCHEDWQVQEDWQKRLGELDTNKLYGPTGISLRADYKPLSHGQIINSNRNEENVIVHGNKVETGFQVGTFDCQCLIVHSSLIEKYHLRFDENLLYDLYVEDFCIQANENHKIPSCIFQLACQHYSHGNVQDNFWQKLLYLRNKYKESPCIYGVAVQGKLIGYHWRRRIVFREIRCFFYQKKLTTKRRLIIKICKIPVWYERKELNHV